MAGAAKEISASSRRQVSMKAERGPNIFFLVKLIVLLSRIKIPIDLATSLLLNNTMLTA